MKIVIKKFKRLDSIELNFKNITLLIGGNNAGKSSIIQAIQFGVSVAQATSLLSNARWKNDSLPTSLGLNELVYLPIKDITYLAQNGRLLEGKTNGIHIMYEELGYSTNVYISKGRNKNIAISIDGKELGEKLQSINNPYSMLVTGLAGIPNEEKYQTPLVVKKSAARGDSNSVFRNILLLLKENNDSWEAFKNEVKEIFPGYQIDVSFDKDRDEFIICNIIKDDNISYPVDSCGTGILQVIQILSYIYLFKPKILLLDEPDSHLHPDNQRLLANRLMYISEQTNTKIVIATHSKYLVDELIDSSGIVWMSQGQIQSCDNNQIVQCLMDIGALSIGERLTPPSWVILTEDTKTELLKKLITSNGAILSDGEIKSYKGCTKVDTAQVLLEHLRSVYPSAKFIIHRDRDFLSNENIQEYQNKFNNVDFLIPSFNDIESYFISKEHLSLSCGISRDEAENIINNAWSNNKERLIKKFVDVKIQQIPYQDQRNEAGRLAAEAAPLQNNYDQELIHGKEMLKFIRQELSKCDVVDKIVQSLETLKFPEISQLFE